MALSVNVIAARLGNCVKIAPSSRPLLMLSPHLDHDMATFPPSLVTYVNIAAPSAAYWRRLGTLNDAANETRSYLIVRLRLIVTSNINVIVTTKCFYIGQDLGPQLTSKPWNCCHQPGRRHAHPRRVDPKAGTLTLTANLHIPQQ